jgi:UDP-N-acetylglucosamine 2-epimerase (non-hydrolysing)
MKKILLVFGTRPEAIKMAPLYHELKKHTDAFNVKICASAQHREMLDQVLDFFNIKPYYDLNLMKQNQTLFDITTNLLTSIDTILEEFQPALVFVQGDTTTTFAASLAAYYKKIKVAHLEAGLRSNNKYSPFPEEINRRLTSVIADYHFAPTGANKINLINEGINDNIYVVGNTVIDALFLGLDLIENNEDDKYFEQFNNIDFSKKIILVTGHRRESFGLPFENICTALKQIATKFDVEIVYPVHLNPNVRQPVNTILSGLRNVHLLEPLNYPSLLWLMNKSYLVLTDSGGIQEEAPSLGKPVLVMRDVTEREEGIEAGTAKLVGTNTDTIYYEAKNLLEKTALYNEMTQKKNPYGNGTTSKQIVDILKKQL